MPTISVVLPYVREAGAKRCADALRADTTYTDYELLMEYDADRIGCPKMVKRLVEKSSGDHICFLADDTLPKKGLLLEAMIVMSTFPGCWGLVGLNSHDLNSGESRASHWLGSKKLLPFIGGEFFHIGYNHSFCDNELVERCVVLQRYKYSLRAGLYHHHPIISMGLPMDDDRKRVLSHRIIMEDTLLFTKRRNESQGWTKLI